MASLSDYLLDPRTKKFRPAVDPAVKQLWGNVGERMYRDMGAAFGNPDGTLRPLSASSVPVDVSSGAPRSSSLKLKNEPRPPGGIIDAHRMLDTPVGQLVKQYAPDRAHLIPDAIGNQSLRAVLQHPVYGGMAQQQMTPMLAPQLQKWGLTPQQFNQAITQPPPAQPPPQSTAPPAPAAPPTLAAAVAPALATGPTAGAAPPRPPANIPPPGASLEGVNPRLVAAVQGGASYLPPGYTIRAVSGTEGRTDPRSHHSKGNAADFQIIKPDGTAIPHKGEDTTGMYTQLARGTKTWALENDPGIVGKIGYGGAFGTKIGGGGVPDLMHYDLGGSRGNMRPQVQFAVLQPLSRSERGVVAPVVAQGGSSAFASRSPPSGSVVRQGGAAISQDMAMGKLQSLGFNEAQSKALVGNLLAESSMRPGAVNKSEGAYGMMQWRGERFNALNDFAAQKGTSWRDPNTQLEFIKHELTTNAYENRQGQRFLQAKTVEDANAGLKSYIRYGEQGGQEGKRLAYAQNVATPAGDQMAKAVAPQGPLAAINQAIKVPGAEASQGTARAYAPTGAAAAPAPAGPRMETLPNGQSFFRNPDGSVQLAPKGYSPQPAAVPAAAGPPPGIPDFQGPFPGAGNIGPSSRDWIPTEAGGRAATGAGLANTGEAIQALNMGAQPGPAPPGWTPPPADNPLRITVQKTSPPLPPTQAAVAQAPRSQQIAPAAAPGPAQGRSKLAQGIMDSWLPHPGGGELTTFREPGTGNEIITGSIGGRDVYRNLGRTPGGQPAPQVPVSLRQAVEQAVTPMPRPRPAEAPGVPMPRPRPAEADAFTSPRGHPDNRDLGTLPVDLWRQGGQAPGMNTGTFPGPRIGPDTVTWTDKGLGGASLPGSPGGITNPMPSVAGSPFDSGPRAFPGPSFSPAARPMPNYGTTPPPLAAFPGPTAALPVTPPTPLPVVPPPVTPPPPPPAPFIPPQLQWWQQPGAFQGFGGGFNGMGGGSGWGMGGGGFSGFTGFGGGM